MQRIDSMSSPTFGIERIRGSVSEDGSSKDLFPISMGNEVKFYSNAYDPEVGGQSRRHAKGAFADMFRDLNAAQSHICIVGWALSSTEKFGENDDRLPELLVKKAREGVKVIVLVWDNIVPVYSAEHKKITLAIETEIAKLPVHEQVFIRQHLNIKFSPREFGYSDHQKMVVADSVLYMGGLDLVHDRSDPDLWHDTHARVEGEIVLSAIDLTHARWDGVKQHAAQDEELNRQFSEIRRSVLFGLIWHTGHRSINPGKIMRLLCSGREKYWGKDHEWCTSSDKQSRTQEIHEAYINSIHRAEKFIYMENQFFIGHRLHKNKKDTVDSSNLVIAAIVNKIIDKINQNENFHFYCQLPLRPEGRHNALDVQVILRKQWKTMEWVIKAVDDVAQLQGKSAADYLTFYNLGQIKNGEYQMKYTHSKLMIVDDQELILGSANCNERSMAGSRDSEVAMHMSGYNEEITNYRERLLCEHFGDEFVSANAKLLIQCPEKKESRELLQKHLDNNLKSLPLAKSPVGTPWGNVPLQQLMERIKPDHILRRTPLPSSVVMGAVQWARKLPL